MNLLLHTYSLSKRNRFLLYFEFHHRKSYPALFGDDVEEIFDSDAVHVGHQHGTEIDGGRLRVHQLADAFVPVLPLT